MMMTRNDLLAHIGELTARRSAILHDDSKAEEHARLTQQIAGVSATLKKLDREAAERRKQRPAVSVEATESVVAARQQLAEARAFVDGLYQKRAALIDKDNDFSTEVNELALPACSGDAAARKRCDAIDRDRYGISQQIRRYDVAISKASPDVVIAEQALQRAVDDERNRQVGEILNGPLQDQARVALEGFTAGVNGLLALIWNVRDARALGAQRPTDRAMMLGISNALRVVLAPIPERFRKELDRHVTTTALARDFVYRAQDWANPPKSVDEEAA